jgi:hypothetical protein
MLEFNPSEHEKSCVSSSFFSCLAKIEEAAQAIESLYSSLEGEYIAIEDESTKALSKEIERLSSCCFRLKVQRAKMQKVGRVMKPERPVAKMQEAEPGQEKQEGGGGGNLDETADWF